MNEILNFSRPPDSSLDEKMEMELLNNHYQQLHHQNYQRHTRKTRLNSERRQRERERDYYRDQVYYDDPAHSQPKYQHSLDTIIKRELVTSYDEDEETTAHHEAATPADVVAPIDDDLSLAKKSDGADSNDYKETYAEDLSKPMMGTGAAPKHDTDMEN